MKKKSICSNDSSVSQDDAPELTEAWFEEANQYRGGLLVKRGRPPQAITKIAVKLRLDRDIVAAFKIDGPGWQTRINQVLREWLASHPRDPSAAEAVVALLQAERVAGVSSDDITEWIAEGRK